MTERSATGRLSVVATPIGNLGDMSARAIETLKHADAILCEDTRQTRKLCTHFGIATPLEALHEHNEGRRADAIVARLTAGAHLALVSDAGTPVVSDPGAHLISRATAAGVPIDIVPGPSAVIAALAISAFPGVPFAFFGFLPQKPGARGRLAARIAQWPDAAVLFISPHRSATELQELARHQPDRPAVLFRELTKRHQATLRGSLSELAAQLTASRPRGEWTLVLGPVPEDPADDRLRAALLAARAGAAAGTSPRTAAFTAADEFGVSRRRVYRRLLEGDRDDAPE